jgi:hypothetical protein
MRFGMSISSALEQAMLDLRELDDPFRSEMNIIGLDKDGTPAAASSAADKTYIYQRTDMDSYVEEPRAFVPYE